MEFDLKNKKIICPLSYGDNNYANEIIRIGEQKLGNNFEPLIKFMPLHQYNNYTQSCSIVIMNHYRQQAVGNVLTLLWMGAKVFLDERNTLYHYLKRLGVYVYNIKQDLRPNKTDVLMPLSLKYQQHNRECLKNEVSQKIILQELQTSINRILCR